jgi:hypothetical protein
MHWTLAVGRGGSVPPLTPDGGADWAADGPICAVADDVTEMSDSNADLSVDGLTGVTSAKRMTR